MSYIRGGTNLFALISSRKELKRELKFLISKANLSKVIKEFKLTIEPNINFIDRILREKVYRIDVQFFACRNPSLIKKMEKIENRILNGSLDFAVGKKRLIRTEGYLFGYPSCCVQKYIAGKEGFPSETSLIMEMIETGEFNRLIKSLDKNRVEPFHYLFTSNFYPCSTDCRRANKIGERVKKWLSRIDEKYAEIFEMRTMINALYNLCTAYTAHEVGSSEILNKTLNSFFRKLDAKWKNLIKDIRPQIRDLTAFTNSFIRRIYVDSQKS